MGYIEGFGFKIYRLREAKPESEYLLFNLKDNKYNEYSKSRIRDILPQELKKNNLDVEKFIVDIIWSLEKKDGEKVRVSQKKISQYINTWIEEETILLDNIGFKPIKDRVLLMNDKTYFNEYNILQTLDNENYLLNEPMLFEEFKARCPYIYKLFCNLHNYDDEAIKDTLYKIADKVQFPFEKSQDCIIFYPAEAAGKGIFFKHIIRPIFENYCSKILMKKLNSDFNAFLRKLLVLVLEEGKRDTELIETLKEVVTEGTILINEKGKNQKDEEVFFLTFVFSNNMNPIDLGKRRGSYHLCKSLGKTYEESQKIGAEMCDNIPNEIDDLLKYLHNLEIEHQKALKPFNTMAKLQVNDLNKNTLELFYDYLCTFINMEAAITDSHKRRFDYTIIDFELVEKDGEIYISKDIVKETYNNFCILEGFKSNLIKHNKDIVQLWALMEIPEDSHARIIIKDGKNKGRRLDHLRLRDINIHLKERFEFLKNE